MGRQGVDGWSNPKVLAIFALLFICGVGCGAVITSSFLHHRLHQVARISPPALGLELLKKKLHLTAQQETIVTKELDDYAKYYQNIVEEREDVAEHGKMRIFNVLDPEQKKIFLQMFKSLPLATGEPAPQ